MRIHHVLALLLITAVGASCRQILGIEEAILICPPEIPYCQICSDASDCGPATECHSWACVDALCTPVNATARTLCSTGVCSETSPSKCVRCVDDADCPGPGGHCDLHQCFSCFDGIKNGREFDVDCGEPCKDCLGLPCTSPDTCISGFCADGRCCTSACTEMCAYCNVPGGGCSALPKYQHDNNPQCGGQYVCDGGGGCRLRASEICTSDVDCASGRCVANRCVKLMGEDCQQNVECAMMLCVNGICTM